MTNSATLRSLVLLSKDGEWGKADAFEGSMEMAVLRGADFEGARAGDLSHLPRRHIVKRHGEMKALKDCDIVIETAGGSMDRPTGRTVFLRRGMLTDSDRPVICASFSRFVRIDPDLAYPEYVYWYLQYLYASGRLLAFHTQHTGVARFQWTTCSESVVIPLPSREVQQRIAATLSAYDELIENNARRVRILEEMAQAIYREWFVEFRFPGHEDRPVVESAIGLVPKGWRPTELASVADVNARSIKGDSVLGEIEYVDIASVSPGRINGSARMDFADAPGRARRLVADGDVIWSTVRPNRRSYALVTDPSPSLIVSTGFAVLTPKRVPSSFLFRLVTTDDFVSYLTNRATGAAYPAVTGRVFEQAPVLLPTADVLDQFAEVAGPLDRLASKLTSATANLQTTRDFLLPRLISGDVDVSGLRIDASGLVA